MGRRLPVRTMRLRAFLWLPAAVLVAMALFEITMDPTPSDRMRLAAIFMALMVVAALAVFLLPRWSDRARSIRFTIIAVGMTSFLIVAGTAIAAAQEMFFSSHDLQLLLVVLGFGLVASFGFAFAVSRPITADLRRIATSAQRVAGRHHRCSSCRRSRLPCRRLRLHGQGPRGRRPATSSRRRRAARVSNGGRTRSAQPAWIAPGRCGSAARRGRS